MLMMPVEIIYVTGIESNVSKMVVGVYGNLITNNQILFDWQVLDILNVQKFGKQDLDVSNIQSQDLSDCKTQCLVSEKQYFEFKTSLYNC
jgi:hypothetical protein